MALTDFERRIRRDQGNIRREERFADYQEGLQGALNRQAEARMAARERRLRERQMIARSDPGRFSSFERNALLGMQHTKSGDIALQDRQEREGLREHEMDMLKQQGENAFREAEQKRFGMKEQGADAAIAHKEAELGKAEEEWATREKIAGIDAETKRYGFDKDAETRKYGFDKDLEGKKYGADATVDVATEQAKGALAVEKERGQALRDVESVRARIMKAQQEHNEGRQNDRWRETQTIKIMNSLRNDKSGKYRNMTPEQLRAIAEKMVGGNGEGGGPKEGDVKTLESGKKAVFRNGQWQLA